ncbi:MAG: DNA polymerase III subunit delta [Verrucomicrobiota bacterium]
MNNAVYLIFGDEYLADMKGKDLLGELLPDDQDGLQSDIIEAAANDSEEALKAMANCMEAIFTVGLFQKSRTVWLRGATFLTDNRVGKTEAVKERVNELARIIKMGETGDSTLVVTAAKVDKRHSFYKACKAAGKVIEYETASTTAAGRRKIIDIAARAGRKYQLDMPQRLLEFFVERVGYDIRLIVGEMQKLSVYKGDDRRVRPEDIRDIVSASSEALGWDLADTFGKRDLAGAVRVLRQLVFQKISPVALIIWLEKRVKDLIVLKEAAVNGWLSERGRNYVWSGVPDRIDAILSGDFDKDPRKMHPYRLKMLALQSSNYSMDELLDCRDRVEACHTRMVTSGLPQDTLLELLLIGIISR